MPGPRLPRVPERTVQAQIVHLLRWHGYYVCTYGTTRPRGDHPGTCQTPGVADLEAFGYGRLLKVEVKARGGRLSPAQAKYRAECQLANVAHVVGGLDEVVAWLAAQPRRACQWDQGPAIAGDVPEEGEAD